MWCTLLTVYFSSTYGATPVTKRGKFSTLTRKETWLRFNEGAHTNHIGNVDKRKYLRREEIDLFVKGISYFRCGLCAMYEANSFTKSRTLNIHSSRNRRIYKKDSNRTFESHFNVWTNIPTRPRAFQPNKFITNRNFACKYFPSFLLPFKMSVFLSFLSNFE